MKYKNRFSPTQVIALGFLITILIGSLLFMLPISRTRNYSYLDALFTATSATCVTGHSTIDAFQDLTIFGQIVLMLLIQIGGLGFILVFALFLLMFGKKITLKNRILISQSVSKDDFEGVVKLLHKIIKYTFSIELIGAFILAMGFSKEFDFVHSLYYGLFHSISAFCNAGFDILPGDSLLPYALDKTINITLMMLIQIGGLGFLVWDDITKAIHAILIEKKGFQKSFQKLNLHTKMVLVMQVILVVLGALTFITLEFYNQETIGSLSLSNKFLVANFQVISARTAGMATIPMVSLKIPTKLLMIFLMLVGGAPGSMAGGLKTVTLMVIFCGMLAIIKGKKNITVFRRTIPREIYEKACTIFLIMFVLTYFSMVIIMCNLTEPLNSLDVLFDNASSIATVGLSTGAITKMNTISICTTIFLMFIGRVGTITTALAFLIERPKENDEVVYAHENVIVG